VFGRDEATESHVSQIAYFSSHDCQYSRIGGVCQVSTTLQQTANWIKPFLNFAPLNIGIQGEPLLTSANLILQTIAGPPFTWPWNRNKATFLTTIGTQDYNQTISDFGYLEGASLQPAANITKVQINQNVATYDAVNSFVAGDLVTVTGTTTSGGLFNVTNVVITAASSTQFAVALVNANVAVTSDTGTAVSGLAFGLEVSTEVVTEVVERGRPRYVGTQVNGNTLTFRFVSTPEQVYQVVVTYQKAPSLFANLGTNWPIPDKLQYIYNYGLLYLMMDFYDDPRAPRYRQMFIATLLGAQSGLKEADRNLFLGHFLDLHREIMANQGKEQQGIQSRQV